MGDKGKRWGGKSSVDMAMQRFLGGPWEAWISGRGKDCVPKTRQCIWEGPRGLLSSWGRRFICQRS